MPPSADHPRPTFVDVDGPVHVADYGGEPHRGTVLCLHGLASSHVGWRRFADALTDDHRVLAVDLPGHGRSPRAGRSADMASNLDVLGRVIDAMATPVVLVGHSMGASLAVLQAAARPWTVESLALLAPPTPRALRDLVSADLACRIALCSWPWLARTTLGRRLRRLGPEEYVKRGLRLTCASTEAVDETTLALLIDRVASGRWADDHATFVEAARSVGLLMARAADYRHAIETAEVPTMVVQGAQDRVVSAAAVARLSQLRPSWDIEILPGVGHSPHMEAPEATALRLRSFLETVRRGAAGPSHPEVRTVPSRTVRPVHDPREVILR